MKQTGEAFGNSAKHLRWQDQAANKTFFTGEFVNFSKEAGEPVAGDRRYQGNPGSVEARRYPLRPVSGRARSLTAWFLMTCCGLCKQLCTSEAAAPISNGARLVLGILFFVLFFARLGVRHIRRRSYRKPSSPIRSRWFEEGWLLLTKHGFLFRHRHHHLAGTRRLRARRAGCGAGRHPDGRVQADRGVLRAVRLIRALSAGVRLHPIANSMGRHRRACRSCSSFSSARYSRSC